MKSGGIVNLREQAPRFLALLVSLAGAACSMVERPLELDRGEAPRSVRECSVWFLDLDAEIDRTGVRDAGAARIEGFPYIRVDRLTASFVEEASKSDAAFADWFERLRRLDQDGRNAELRNLPKRGDRADLIARAGGCADELARHDAKSAALRNAMLARATVPDDYLDWQRAAGLYPIARWPFAYGVKNWHEEAMRQFALAPASSKAVGYALVGEKIPATEIVGIMTRSYAAADALGIPSFLAKDLDRLFDANAPTFVVDTTGKFDAVGSLVWAGEFVVDTASPTVYRRLAYTRFGGRILPQLVYTVWFTERPANGLADILAGKLDGVVLRVTLSADGAPLIYDTIHPCGCYHMFFPTAKVEALPPPDSTEEWAFIPKTLPALAPGERVRIHIESRTHYVVGIEAGETLGDRVRNYRFADEDDLRSLPVADGERRSLYGPDGLVESSFRPERFLFWPMGIPSAGTMRQWGRHPTAFLGRRHFDDARLLEQRFRVVEP